MSDDKNPAAPDEANDEPQHEATTEGTFEPLVEPEDEGRSRLAGVASSIADAAAPVWAAARRVIDERPGARVRRVRRMAKDPLRNLWEEHPETQRASIRELGLRTIAVDEIQGTAVAGPAQRGGDFLPLRDRRSVDWRGRWQRILKSQDRLAALPPIDAIKFGDGYWVVDGHNRVAAALYIGQTDVDALVEELRLPGMAPEPPVRIASMLEGSLDLRRAGEGRLTRTVEPPPDETDR